MKNKTPEEIILESWEGTRNSTDFFKSLSDEAYFGYVTGMTIAQNHKIGIRPIEVFNIVKQILK